MPERNCAIVLLANFSIENSNGSPFNMKGSTLHCVWLCSNAFIVLLHSCNRVLIVQWMGTERQPSPSLVTKATKDLGVKRTTQTITYLSKISQLTDNISKCATIVYCCWGLCYLLFCVVVMVTTSVQCTWREIACTLQGRSLGMRLEGEVLW